MKIENSVTEAYDRSIKVNTRGYHKLTGYLKEILSENSIYLLIGLLSLLSSCNNEGNKIHPVTYAQFEQFVAQTGYTTDAEKYGWSIVQQDVYNFKVVEGATWKKPDGANPPISKQLPITQVSYNDALAYCKWAGVRLPSYKEYWELIKQDQRVVVADNKYPISPVDEVNVIGNVWDITSTEAEDQSIRLAGGSLFCSKNTCHGTVETRELFVDKETGNIHIGFSVIYGE